MGLRLPATLLKSGLMILVYPLMRLYLSSLRVRMEGKDRFLEQFHAGHKAIAAIWHQRFLAVLGYATKYSGFKPSVMISRSKDGDLISPIVARLGIRPVRGSSSRGGKEALSAMIKALAVHPAAGHIVDGPRGPKGIVKPGIIAMAQESGAPILPMYISSEKAWLARSWDRFMIPKPFTRVFIRWGRPVYVPSDVDEKEFEDIRLMVENALEQGHAHEDLSRGWGRPL